MTTPLPGVHNIEAILFDMNGTLRVREQHEPTQQAAFSRLGEILGEGEHDWDELTRRQKAYSIWAQEQLLQSSEAEIWSRWILPEFSREQIEPVAAELMLAWSERKGRVVPIPGAEATLVELKRRGYRLGVISNTMSTLDIPRSLVAFGWQDFFDVVILSSVLKIRKPSPEPFIEAVIRMDLPPEHCAYVGNRISKDIVGCKRAGFALGLIIEPSSQPRVDEQDQTARPDAVISMLSGLLEIFPARKVMVSKDILQL
jgi:putative hydrolase of the HAD superfamily